MLLLAVASFVGCGGDKLAETAQLQGAITIDGQPIEQGALQFLPLEQGPAASAVIANGRYQAQVTHGNVRVMVTATRTTGKMLQELTSSYPEVVNLVPVPYRKGIEIEVTGDNAQQDFHLRSE